MFQSDEDVQPAPVFNAAVAPYAAPFLPLPAAVLYVIKHNPQRYHSAARLAYSIFA